MHARVRARKVEIRGIRELKAGRGRVGISWDTVRRSQCPGAIGDYVGTNLLIVQVGKLRPSEGRTNSRSQSQGQSSYRRGGVMTSYGWSEVDQPRPWHRPGSCPHKAPGFLVLILGAEIPLSLAHPRMLLASDWSGAGSGWVGRDFGWRRWENGVAAEERGCWKQGPDQTTGWSVRAALFLFHPPMPPLWGSDP